MIRKKENGKKAYLSDRGLFKNMMLTISDDNDEIIEAIERYREVKVSSVSNA